MLKKILIAIPLILLLLVIFYFPKLNKVHKTIHFFDKDKIFFNFTNTNAFSSSNDIIKSTKPFTFPKGDPYSMPTKFTFGDRDFEVAQFIDTSQTTGLLVIQNDSLRFEEYYMGHHESGPHISWSMAKSYVSALMGIAIEEGLIKSIEQNVEEYLPELKGSGYEGVRIKDVLQMSSGVAFNEDYGDFSSDINRWGRSFAWGASQDDFAASLINEKPPGTYNHYVSIDTHVLGMIIVKVTGKSLSQYLKEKIWEPIGAEHDAYWLTDDTGMEMALGGLNITLRDYAKLGQLYLHKGNWNGQQLVPEAWAVASVTPDGAHVTPGDNPNSANAPWGYGFQWWIPEGSDGEFMARGVYNQYIYVNPTTNTVIVKNSANYNFNDPTNPTASGDVHLEMFREIARSLVAERMVVSEL